MRICLAFSQTSDGCFLVLAKTGKACSSATQGHFALATYDHEDTFLELVMGVDLDPNDTVQLVSTVLLSVSQPVFPQRWVEVDLSVDQSDALGLHDPEKAQPEAEEPSQAAALEPPLDFTSDAAHFYDFLMQAPTPFVMFSGPQHRCTFINLPYVHLMGQAERDDILGKSVREIFPELEGQVFFGLLDRVYRTGIPYVGNEVYCRMRRRYSSELEDRYFDFIYHPVRNADGEVNGIMVQAMDVTERVLAGQVSEQREQQLYNQWAVLDAIYRTSSVGMALFDARSLRVLRINQRQAAFAGAAVDDLVGKRILEVFPDTPSFVDLVERVAGGEHSSRTLVRQKGLADAPGPHSWLVNLTPALGASGEITAVSAIFLEVPELDALVG